MFDYNLYDMLNKLGKFFWNKLCLKNDKYCRLFFYWDWDMGNKISFLNEEMYNGVFIMMKINNFVFLFI